MYKQHEEWEDSETSTSKHLAKNNINMGAKPNSNFTEIFMNQFCIIRTKVVFRRVRQLIILSFNIKYMFERLVTSLHSNQDDLGSIPNCAVSFFSR